MLRLSLKNIVFELMIAMPALYTLLNFFPGTIGNKIILVVLILCFVLLNQIYIRKARRWHFIITDTLLALYVVYIGLIEGPKKLIDVQFYGFVFLFIVFLLFSDDDIRSDFFQYFNSSKNRFIVYVALFAAAVIYSVIFMDGLQVKSYSPIPVLYGPYGVGHMLAYVLIVIYCGCAVYDRDLKSKLFIVLRVLCVICIFITAVRTATLAIAVIVVTEFLSIRKAGTKVIIAAISILVLVTLLVETDILINNPIIQKTLYASEVGGSVTNGREWYRDIEMDYYFNSTNLFQKLFGVGMTSVYECIDDILGVRIHAHNDYVNILVGYGLVALVMFIICQLRLSKICNSIWSKILFQVFIFILAYYNGFAMYIMLTVSFPIVMCFFESCGLESGFRLKAKKVKFKWK